MEHSFKNSKQFQENYLADASENGRKTLLSRQLAQHAVEMLALIQLSHLA